MDGATSLNMPISAAEWEAGNIESQLKPEILKLLQKTPEAYTAEEIMNHVLQFRGEPWGEFLGLLGSMDIIQATLDELVESGNIISKMINRELSSPVMYYRAAN